MSKRMTSSNHSPKRIHSMKKNARPSSDRTADGDRDREIRLIVVDDAPRAASGEPAGVRATPVIIFLVVARGSSRSTDLHRLASDRVVARGSEATRAAKRRRRGLLTPESGVWLVVNENFVSAVVRSDARECSKRASGRRNTRISVSIGVRG